MEQLPGRGSTGALFGGAVRKSMDRPAPGALSAARFFRNCLPAGSFVPASGFVIVELQLRMSLIIISVEEGYG